MIENFCEIFTRELSRLEKNIFIYEPGQESNLIAKINNVYGVRKLTDAKKLMRKIKDLLNKIKFYSDLSGLQVYIIEYYINFLELDEQIKVLQEISESITFHDEQIKFFPVYVQSGAGIYRQIDKIFSGTNYRIFEDFCAGQCKYNYVFKNCPFYQGEEISYIEGGFING